MMRRLSLAIAWGSTLILVQLAIFLASRPRTEVIGAGLLPARDDANGFLCYIGESQCFAYTPTAGAQDVQTGTSTLIPTVIVSMTSTGTSTPTASPSATPTFPATATPLPPTIIVPRLLNGDFEQIAEGNPRFWSRWDESGGPQWKSEISPPGDVLAVHSGSTSMRMIDYGRCWRYGIFQTIPAPAGRNVKISAWFLTLGSQISSLRHADPNMNSEIGIGVDKYGLTDPHGSDVSWRFAKGENLIGPLIGGNYEPFWTQMSSVVRIPSDSSLITVFLSLDLGRTRTGNCMWAVPVTIGIVDDANIEVVP